MMKSFPNWIFFTRINRRKQVAYFGLLFLLFPAALLKAQSPSIACPVQQKDWKRAVWRVPLHIALSAPVAAGSLIVPPLGKKYVRWRVKAEKLDQAQGRDTCMKALVDEYSQTALVRAVLRIYKIKAR